LAAATDYYVATTGSDSNPGTLDQPFATLQKGANVAMPGDTVYIRGGTYRIVTPATSNAGISITKSGTSDTNRIRFWAYQAEVPVFDFTGMMISTTGYTNGVAVSGSFLHFKGLEIENVPMNMYSNNGMSVSNASNDIFELLHFHHNNGTGLFIGKGSGGHHILNCDSHDNYDPTSNQGDGQNADGFGLHYQTAGAVSTFTGCRAWWNSDDGYDFINQEVSGVIESSWAMGNGYIKSGTARPAAGNGNGFKVGSSKMGVRHVAKHNLAWKNVAAGFYANHSSGGNDWYDNTSYSNGTQYNMLASDPNDSSVTIILTGDKVHRMRNNIGFPNKNSNMNGVDTAFNTWDLGITPAAGDFASVDDAGFMGPRQADGSLPALDFMRLRAQSPMIDKGTDVGLPFAGTAPDLGAFEYGLTSSGGASGGGGMSGMGGMSSAGGASSAGGTSSAGGLVGAGGTSGSRGGAAGSVGTASGGAPNVGGTSSAGAANAAGETGGSSNVAAGGTAASSGLANGASGDSGCGCRVRGTRSPDAPRESLAVFAAGAIAVILLGRRRKPNR
jgi:hypothetical protein